MYFQNICCDSVHVTIQMTLRCTFICSYASPLLCSSAQSWTHMLCDFISSVLSLLPLCSSCWSLCQISSAFTRFHILDSIIIKRCYVLFHSGYFGLSDHQQITDVSYLSCFDSTPYTSVCYQFHYLVMHSL